MTTATTPAGASIHTLIEYRTAHDEYPPSAKNLMLFMALVGREARRTIAALDGRRNQVR